MTKTNLLFVYGTLMKGFENPVARHLHSTQNFLGEAYFPGLLFKVSFYPGAVCIPDSENKVYGHLFKITQNQKQLLQKLDDYEGIGTQFKQPNEFKRDVIPVFFKGQSLTAYTYLFNAPYNQYPVITSGRFSEEA
ncbi:gamma-glutamylcyclotransferase family protein [Gracilimonas sp.]|uniref:gamma-glutamylcyclotransferase family protein n=1 Tax=Gracilimonas sp. TaxID=1974203 RepID=UPI0032EF1B35